MYRVTYAGLTDRGRLRPQNEDNWFGDAKQGLFIVSDGRGGQRGGAIASQLVVELLPTMLRERLAPAARLPLAEWRKQLSATLEDLSLHIRISTWGQSGLHGMGATVVAALIHEDHAIIAHLGDSRAYLLRDGSLNQLTKDHSVVQFLVDAGEIQPEEVRRHPARGQITRFVGMVGEALPDLSEVALRPGDRFLLCTDGLTGLVLPGQIKSILESRSAVDRICARLINAANLAGGYDNITAVVVSILE